MDSRGDVCSNVLMISVKCLINKIYVVYIAFVIAEIHKNENDFFTLIASLSVIDVIPLLNDIAPVNKCQYK